MTAHASRLRAAMLLAAVLIGSTACGPVNQNARVRVFYEQVANFHTYTLDPNSSSTTGASDGMFILYRVINIQNTGSQAAPFAFDKFKVATITPDQTSNETVTSDNILLGGDLIPTPFNVPAGQTVTSGRCFIKHALTPNPQNLANTTGLVELFYQINTQQPVSMIRAAGDTDVALVIPTALPSALQNLC